LKHLETFTPSGLFYTLFSTGSVGKVGQTANSANPVRQKTTETVENAKKKQRKQDHFAFCRCKRFAPAVACVLPRAAVSVLP